MSQPRPSNARPTKRASSVAVPPRGKARSSSAPAAKPKSKPRLDPNDAGVKRRAAKRAARKRSNAIAWTLLALATILVSGALGVASNKPGVFAGALGIWREYQGVVQKVGAKEAMLADLRAQLERGQRRVAAQNTREGKERALVEGGYLGQGERFLLFPKDKKKAPRD